MDYLVTGGCGFLGRHFVEFLLRKGHHVTVVDNLHSLGGGLHPSEWHGFDPRDSANFRFFEMDCRTFFETTLESYDYVVHAAAIVGGRRVLEEQPLAVATDISLDVAALDFVRKSGSGRLIYFSSSAAYPLSLQSPENHRALREDDIDFELALGIPDLAYGWAKLSGEYLARLAEQRYGLKISIYRPFSGYGFDQDDSYPFPAIIQRALLHRGGPFEVWGSGDQVRDFIHIDDCIQMIYDSCDRLSPSQPVNLSTAKPSSFKEFASIVFDEIGMDSTEVVGTANTPEGAFYRVGDRAFQESLSDFTPRSFREGIREALSISGRRN